MRSQAGERIEGGEWKHFLDCRVRRVPAARTSGFRLPGGAMVVPPGSPTTDTSGPRNGFVPRAVVCRGNGGVKFLDLHYHVAPDLFARRETARQAGRRLKRAGAAAVLKSHLGSTAQAVRVLREEGCPVYAAHVMNACAGGIDYRRVLLEIGKLGATPDNPLLVFFPTITEHLRRPPAMPLAHPALGAAARQPEPILLDGRLRLGVWDVLRLGRDYAVRFATGHASAEAVRCLVDAADRVGLDRLLLTHPTEPAAGYSVRELERLARNPLLWFETTARGVLAGRQSETDFRRFLKLPRAILSSDLGQPDTLAHERWPEEMLTVCPLDREWADRVFRLHPARFLGVLD